MLKYNPQLRPRARRLRNNLTDAEQRMWNRLRAKQILGIQFYRQRPIDNYIVDFYAPVVRLVIEVDGAQHLDTARARYDRRRSKCLEQLGLKVLRFDDRQGLLELDSVVQVIFGVVSESLDSL
ncbi:MAG: endonuclease domain-containing protein [Deltaproteobacteria bacterium]|nr:endonuclease domain-containing protein [Deltaproteobacteria bacterium]